MDGVTELVSAGQAVADSFAVEPGRFDAEIALRLVLQALLLVGSAFFSSSETALFSLSPLDLQELRRQDHPRTNTLYRLLEQPRRLIISVLCGNELINVAAAANMAAILVTLYGPADARWINIVVMVPLLLLFGEVTPKTIAVSNPVQYSTRIVAAPLTVWVWLITPVRTAIRFVADRVATWIVGAEKAPENLLRVDEFKTLVAQAEEEGGISPGERTLIYNIIAATKTEIVEIMTPRTRSQFVNASRPLDQVMERVQQSRHSRIPVYRDVRDHIIGMLHAEDFLPFAAGERDLDSVTLEDLLHPPVMIPPTKTVDEMFDFFQHSEDQAAVVINEFGGVDGLITLVDVLRFIFGHVAAPGTGQPLYEETDDNHYVVPGEMKLADFNDLTHFGLDDPRMTTIGGVVLRALDRLPQVGDEIAIDGITLAVREMDGHRVARVEVARRVHDAERDGEDG